jgi:hypothetical protein
VRVDPAEADALANGLHPAVCGTPIQAAAVVTDEDGTVPALTDSQVDRAGGARH